LLSGEQRASADEAIDAIAEALEHDADAGGDGSLAGGLAGIAVFFHYLAKVRGEARFEGLARERIARGLELSADPTASPSLHGGWVGVEWVASLIGQATSGADERLLAAVAGWPPDGEYDLVSGLVGCGVYALERDGGEPALRQIISGLARSVVVDSDGARWPSPAPLARAPESTFNLGLAHGSPGVVGVLGRVAAAGCAGEREAALLSGAVGWLRAQAREAGGGPCFDFTIGPGGEGVGPARTAWCYGEPGIAAALLLAGCGAGREDWVAWALELAHAAADRHPGATGVNDAGLCHGAAGLAHTFNRLAQATGDAGLEVAARKWYALSLAMRQPGRGCGGYRAVIPIASGELRGWPDPGFLTGAAGVGLALLAAVSDVEPEWDRALLLSG
jgi:lantibiotic modifying enzyme